MRLLRTFLLLALSGTACLAAPTLSQQIDSSDVNVGSPVRVTITVANGAVKSKDSSSFFGMVMSSPDIKFPPVDGLRSAGYQSMTSSNNGNVTTIVTVTLIPVRAGDFTIPAFDIAMEDGSVLHTQPIKLHATQGANTPSANAPQIAATPAPGSSVIINPPFNPNGPVTMPPGGVSPPDTTANGTGTASDANGATISVPVDKDGQPMKVFVIATPKTTDAYVGETVPMRIECYIRIEVMAQQDSLPTIKGSNFLMNNLSTRPGEDEVTLMGIPYHRETWVTAISAAKSGDLPFQMERDTYWTKASRNLADPFGNLFFNHPDMEHQPVDSNPMVFHVHPLPEEGKPDNFTGAIGDLKVTGTAGPTSVTVGQPVTLHFSVSGEGNFDYVKCPSLAPDPAWKSYVPSSKIDYLDASHTQGVKNFEQAIIPQKNGTVPLPAASFSYFDPTTKKYVTIPVNLPAITVTGSLPVVATPPPAEDTTAAETPAAKGAGLLPNRLEFGPLHASLTPIYHHLWFWILQGGLALLLLLGTLLLFLRSHAAAPETRADEAQRQRFLHQEEDAMADAVRRGDAVAFFTAARHAVQLQLGVQWRMNPESITLAEIRQRDPERAEMLGPLFTQANEVIYSGGATRDLNLTEWELQVRQQLLQLQPAAV